MRRFILLVAALALASCATAPSAPPDQVADDGMTWILSLEGREEPALFYGVPESDHILLMMACREGLGEVEVSVFGSPKRPTKTLHLASGPARLRKPARSEPSLLHDEAITATTSANSDVLERFAETGVLAVGTTPWPAPLPAAPVATARRFVDLCQS